MWSFELDGSLSVSLNGGSLSTLITEISTVSPTITGLESQIKDHNLDEEKYHTNLEGAAPSEEDRRERRGRYRLWERHQGVEVRWQLPRRAPECSIPHRSRVDKVQAWREFGDEQCCESRVSYFVQIVEKSAVLRHQQQRGTSTVTSTVRNALPTR